MLGGIAGGICLYKHAKKVKEDRELIEEFLGSEELGEDMEILFKNSFVKSGCT